MMKLMVTISTSNDIKIIVLTALITSLLFILLIVNKNYRFIRQLQQDNEKYRSKTIQQLNEKNTNDS